MSDTTPATVPDSSTPDEAADDSFEDLATTPTSDAGNAVETMTEPTA